MTFEEQAPRPLHELTVALSRSRPAFVPTAQSFPPLVADEIAEDMKLYVRAAAAGQHGDPPSGSAGPDRLETEIAAAIQEHMRESTTAYEMEQAQREARMQEQCVTAEERQHIETVVGSALAELEANMQYVREWLQEMWRETVAPVEMEFEHFRVRHGLVRDPRLPSRVEQWFRVLAIMGLVVVGTAITQGWLTSGLEPSWRILAAAWSAFDIAIAVWFARSGLPALAYRSFGSKLRGVVALAFFLACLAGLNLLAAHCREVLAMGGGVSLTELWHRISGAPFALEARRSWLVAALGCSLSLAALRVAAGFDDVYPHYGALGRRLVAAIEAFESERASCAQSIAGLRNTTRAELEAPIEALRQRELAARAATEARVALHRSYAEYLDHVGQVHVQLCKRYRDINRVARQSAPPEYFDGEVQRPQFLHPPELVAPPASPEDGWIDVRQWLENQRELLADSATSPIEHSTAAPGDVPGAAPELVGADA